MWGLYPLPIPFYSAHREAGRKGLDQPLPNVQQSTCDNCPQHWIALVSSIHFMRCCTFRWASKMQLICLCSAGEPHNRAHYWEGPLSSSQPRAVFSGNNLSLLMFPSQSCLITLWSCCVPAVIFRLFRRCVVWWVIKMWLRSTRAPAAVMAVFSALLCFSPSKEDVKLQCEFQL